MRWSKIGSSANPTYIVDPPPAFRLNSDYTVQYGRNQTDMDEAVAWVKRCPNPMPGLSEIEIRPLYEMADLR